MKTNFAKKTIKISLAVFLTCFLLVVFVRAQEDNNLYTNPGLTTGSIIYYDEETETYPCSDSSNGECVMETRKYKKDKNIDGYEITQVIQKPNDGISGGEISEYYTDNNGQEWYKTGTVNSGNDVTSLSNWTQGEKTEIKTTNNTSGGKFTYTLLQSLPKEGTDLSENVTLEEYMTWAFRFVLALAGFLAVMMIVIGGVEYIISGASEAMRGEAKKRIENAIWGLVMALVSYLVLYTINPSLVDFKNNSFLNEEKTTTSSGSNSNGGNNSNGSNVGDINKGVTDVKDLQFDFDDIDNDAGYVDDVNYIGF